MINVIYAIVVSPKPLSAMRMTNAMLMLNYETIVFMVYLVFVYHIDS